MDSLAPSAPSQAAADLLGEKRRTVDSWRRFEVAPSFRSALNIVRVSKGAVDFNGIYYPIWRAIEDGRSKINIQL